MKGRAHLPQFPPILWLMPGSQKPFVDAKTAMGMHFVGTIAAQNF
jgi:hypothetical protein